MNTGDRTVYSILEIGQFTLYWRQDSLLYTGDRTVYSVLKIRQFTLYWR